MNLLQLEYALTLERMGSFTKAAKTLSLSQPALSLQIKNLESEIGISLFDRSKARVEPTEQGKQFLLKAGEIVSASKQLKDYARSLANTFEGTLSIGVIPTLSPFLVPLFVDELISSYPKVSIQIHELLTEQILQQLRAGDLDGGLISTPIQRQGIEVQPLFYESFYFYQTDDQKKWSEPFQLTNMDLRDLWLLEEGNCFRDQVNDICSIHDREIAGQLKYYCSSIDSLIRMVDHYGGITILPELTTLSLDANQEKDLILIPDKIREIGFISRKLSGKEHLIDVLCQSIVQCVPKRMKEKRGREVVSPGIKTDW